MSTTPNYLFRLIWKRRRPGHIEEDHFNVSKWYCQNYLLLNPDKTKLLGFGSRQKTAEFGDFKFSLLGKELLPVPNGNDLGVILENNLIYDDYITRTVSLCFSRLAQINRVKHAFNKKTLINIIYKLVFSKLLYCSNVWANTSNRDMRKLQSCQNYACRIISGAKKYYHISPLLKELNWLPVEKLMYLRSATLAFKCMTGSAPDYLTSKFITS